jgi:hypothetical protein
MSKILMSIHQQKLRDMIRSYHQRQRNGGIANTKNPYAMPRTLNVWITHFDNLFAKTVFGSLDSDEVPRLAPVYPTLTSLCHHCSNPKTGIFSRGSFLVSYDKAQESKTTCSLCAIIYEKMNSTIGDNSGKVVLQEGSSLTTARGELPLFSLVVGPSRGMYCSPLLRINTDRRQRSQSFPRHLPERFSHSTYPWNFYSSQIVTKMAQVV